MITIYAITICALLCSMFALYIVKKQDETIEIYWVSIYYLIAFLQSEYEDFGERSVKMKDANGKDVELDY